MACPVRPGARPALYEPGVDNTIGSRAQRLFRGEWLGIVLRVRREEHVYGTREARPDRTRSGARRDARGGPGPIPLG